MRLRSVERVRWSSACARSHAPPRSRTQHPLPRVVVLVGWWCGDAFVRSTRLFDTSTRAGLPPSEIATWHCLLRRCSRLSRASSSHVHVPSLLSWIDRSLHAPPGFANPGVAPVDRSVSSAARTRWALLPHPASTLSVCHFWLNSNSEVRRSMFACSHIRIRIHCTACELSRVHLQISYPAINSLIPILRLPVVPCLTNCRRLP
jgi:hypothetical protein